MSWDTVALILIAVGAGGLVAFYLLIWAVERKREVDWDPDRDPGGPDDPWADERASQRTLSRALARNAEYTVQHDPYPESFTKP